MESSLQDGPTEKPSFLSFLKKTKQKQKEDQDGPSKAEKGKKKQSAKSSDEEASSSTDGAQLAKEKAKARRAQVRKAQIEHRQRKANYVKQLELDISQLREMVTQIQRDSDTLKSENDLIRNALIANGTSPPGLSAGSTTQPTASTIATPSAVADAQDYPPTFEPYALDSLSSDTDMTVTLSMSKTMGTPCFSVAPFSPSAASANNEGGWICGSIRLTPAQELQAINFILALEHCCWEHFFDGDCHHHKNKSIEDETGHALMATSYVMASAPPSVYEERKQFKKFFRPSPTLQWSASPVSLEALHSLAQSLNPGTDEVAPVQAWFELALRYPVEVLTNQNVLNSLKREFKGVVRCVVFGAAIERSVFESIIFRVLGPATGGAVTLDASNVPQLLY